MKRYVLIFFIVIGQLLAMQNDALQPLSNTECIANNHMLSAERLASSLRLKDSFKKKYQLSEIHSVIQQEIINAFKICNITEPVILLQDEHSTNSGWHYWYRDDLLFPIKILVIGVADETGSSSLSLIRGAIYHECGHYVNGDLKSKSWVDAGMFVGSGLVTSAVTYNFLNNKASLMSSICLSGLCGCIAPFFLSKIYKKSIGAYVSREKELNADLFEIQTLLKNNDLEPLIISFLDLTYNMDEGRINRNNEHWILHDHPSYFERAKLILSELKKAGFNLKNIPLVNPEKFNKETYQIKFNTQILKHFPEFA